MKNLPNKILFLLFFLPSLAQALDSVSVMKSDWTGFYVGLAGGHSWNETTTDMTPTGSFSNPPFPYPPNVLENMKNTGSFPIRDNGFLGGIELGYNFQFYNFVIGLEADFLYTDLNNKVSKARDVDPPFNYPFAVSRTVKSDWMSTVRGRFGYSIGDFLPYITGGLAIRDYYYRSRSLEANTFYESTKHSDEITGWTIGGGVEYAIDERFSIKAEYLYADFSDIDGEKTAQIGWPTYTFNHQTIDLTEHIFKMGVNFRF